MKRNIKRILGLILIPLSFIIPKTNRRWLFGSNMGYTGNAKHLYIYVLDNYKEQIRAFWITDKKEIRNQMRKKGLPVAYKWSIKGIYYCLTSKIYFFNSYVSDINEYTFGNVVRVNLWHGVALKHIERTKKNPEKKYTTKNIFIKFRYFRFLIKPSFVLSPSPIETELFAHSFGVDAKKCIEGTYPRNEIFKLNQVDLIEYIEKYEYDSELIEILEKIESYDYRIIYMPTWRDSGRNFLEQISLDLTKLNEALQKINGCMIFKLHPATQLNVNLNNFSNLFLIDNNTDIYPLLPFTNCLITDYSSIYYDYILMSNKRIILYIPDFEEYTNSDRDFAFPFNESVEGEKIYNFHDLSIAFNNWSESINNNKNIKNIIQRFWRPKINGNAELVKFFAQKIDLSLND